MFAIYTIISPIVAAYQFANFPVNDSQMLQPAAAAAASAADDRDGS